VTYAFDRVAPMELRALLLLLFRPMGRRVAAMPQPGLAGALGKPVVRRKRSGTERWIATYPLRQWAGT